MTMQANIFVNTSKLIFTDIIHPKASQLGRILLNLATPLRRKNFPTQIQIFVPNRFLLKTLKMCG